MSSLIVPALAPFVPAWARGHLGAAARFAAENCLFLAVLFLGYRLLHRAMRLRLIERLVVLTSLTHFSFWRRYRSPR